MSHPVTLISWYDAAAYAEWAGKRLLTEVEWEKAARGIDARKWPWGNQFDATRVNSLEANSANTTSVDAHRGGASPYGVLSLIGNTWEWTASQYDGTSILRGGSWYDRCQSITCCSRSFAPSHLRSTVIGFRCARSA